MNQEKIGKFIALCRKEAGYTQSALAEKLGVTDRAVSKWENGRSLPDVSIMQELCKLIHIDVNELFCGEHLDTENYKEMAEKNLLHLQEQEILNNKKLLSLEIVIGYMSTISFMVFIFTASYAVSDSIWRNAMIIIGVIIFLVGVFFCLKLERETGYYECPYCEERYVPSMKNVVFATHIGRSRKLRCPKCGKRGYHKKKLVK